MHAAPPTAGGANCSEDELAMTSTVPESIDADPAAAPWNIDALPLVSSSRVAAEEFVFVLKPCVSSLPICNDDVSSCRSSKSFVLCEFSRDVAT